MKLVEGTRPLIPLLQELLVIVISEIFRIIWVARDRVQVLVVNPARVRLDNAAIWVVERAKVGPHQHVEALVSRVERRASLASREHLRIDETHAKDLVDVAHVEAVVLVVLARPAAEDYRK